MPERSAGRRWRKRTTDARDAAKALEELLGPGRLRTTDRSSAGFARLRGGGSRLRGTAAFRSSARAEVAGSAPPRARVPRGALTHASAHARADEIAHDPLEVVEIGSADAG